MKNKKSLLAALVLLSGASVMSSCNKTKVTEKDGIEYTYIKEGSQKPANGEFLLYHLDIVNADDSVIYTTSTQPVPGYVMANDSIPVNNGMDEIFLGLRKGDSINFESTAQVIFGPNFPPFLNAEDQLKIRIGAIDIMTQEALMDYFSKAEEAENAKRAERAKTLLVEDGKKIEEYASANGLDVQKTENGLYYVIETPGSGDEVTPGTTMYVNYAGYLIDGTLFDTSYEQIAKDNDRFNPQRDYEPLPVNVGMGQVIPGWDEGLLLLKKGSKAKFLIPSPLGYGENGAGGLIGPNSILVFDVEVTDVQK
ncbi:FKBP-type peptidyl-prolyl cis-trans isomerase [Algoriphagus zhangzhouensis]|uniref:Peptidyl-prolyl cis-trans isomerase n=1 Tax=Algoriphagus zhangzhouensis TaxID=1073327 RepID=A0A1M7ZA79_9BACT|nr:FKBP-type peptidyl-prolyl cis-trans isomerase [Algoriphagus zhangzhouensis]TDY47222.1 FKBP-type peptidyl-prolyl cis-trans isomerase [Algoriphagus zhangzhouensis]SHO61811.1 FKBP-type peptidyl-prolyl cis-trans isomerase [Algoriphagus zhangzhouensis]